MDKGDIIRKAGCIAAGVILILVSVFIIPDLIGHLVPPLIEVVVVFLFLLLAYYIIWKGIGRDTPEGENP
jgi:hypothetical protein